MWPNKKQSKITMKWKRVVDVNWLLSQSLLSYSYFYDTMNNALNIDCLDACDWNK